MINVQVLDFPSTSPKEMVTENADGSYTIFLNAKQSYEQQRRSLAHALGHITENDFEKFDVQQIEAEAHSRK